MNVGSRCEVFLIATSLAWTAALGCHRESAETQQLVAAAARAYEPLKPKLAQLQTTLAGLHKDADRIATQVPGGQPFREKLLAADEVLGTTDARVRWLGGEIEAAKAKRDAKKEEVAVLADQVTKTSADLDQVNAVAVDLTHENARLERVGALMKAPYERVLPTGYRIKAASSGIEAHLIEAIQKKGDAGGWIDFDRLLFTGESADIDFPQSRSQLQNVAEILKAYPAVKVKIGGYTDNAGPAAHGKKLSTDRAQAVRTALIQMGLQPARVEAEGYGSAHPICPANDTEFCRARNRRIAVQVTAAG